MSTLGSSHFPFLSYHIPVFCGCLLSHICRCSFWPVYTINTFLPRVYNSKPLTYVISMCLCVQGSPNQQISVTQAMSVCPMPTRLHPRMGKQATSVCPDTTAQEDLPKESNAQGERLVIVSDLKTSQNVGRALRACTARQRVSWDREVCLHITRILLKTGMDFSSSRSVFIFYY